MGYTVIRLKAPTSSGLTMILQARAVTRLVKGLRLLMLAQGGSQSQQKDLSN